MSVGVRECRTTHYLLRMKVTWSTLSAMPGHRRSESLENIRTLEFVIWNLLLISKNVRMFFFIISNTPIPIGNFSLLIYFLVTGLPRIFSYGIKVVWQSLTLLVTLIPKRRSSYLIIQNPPAIPAVPICWFYCAIMRVQFVIDWHNYAYTIQALGSKSDDVFVRLTRVIEFWFGRKARGNICVSQAMKIDLEKRWKIE